MYKKIELTGSSYVGIQETIENAVGKASQTINNMRLFKVIESRGHIDDRKGQHWQVSIKVGFTIE